MGRLMRLDLTVPQTRALLELLRDTHPADRASNQRIREIESKLSAISDGRLISDMDKIRAAR